MKKLAALTISLLTAFSAMGGITAFAAESGTIYPQDSDFINTLTFTALSDYAVNGEVYAFSQGNAISVFENGNLTEYSLKEKVTALDCADGVFYYSDANGTYSLPDKKEAEYTLSESQTTVNLGDYTYKLTDGILKVADFGDNGNVKQFEGTYSKLNQYGDKVYAVKANELYLFDGEAEQKIVLEYADYTVTQEIAVGQAAAALKNYKLEFVTVQAGSYMTEVDLTTTLDAEYFTCGDTVTAEEQTCALLLCKTGNASIVAIGDTSYILLTEKTQTAQINCYTEKEFESATIIGNRIYASPYVETGTSAVADATGSIVSVLNKLEYEGVLGSAYYEVLYTNENGATKVGYVADGFLTEYIIEDNKQPSVIPDPDHSEQNNAKTVLLVLAVVVLVLVAAGYLAYIGTADKRKKKTKEKEQPKQTSEE